MVLASTFVLVALLATLAPALGWDEDYRGALYVLSQTDEQQILVSSLYENGSAAFVTSIPTGGKGTGARGPDPLQAADGLVVADNLLFAVNPSSNELSLFEIDRDEPWSPKQVGNNTSSGGDYPTSLAVSPDMSKVCVTNSGTISNVRCFAITKSGLQIIEDFDFRLDLNQTNPPVGPPKTPSDLAFSANGQQLVVSIKGAANASEEPYGRIELFSVSDMDVVHKSTAYAAYGPGGLPFSITPIANSAAWFLTDPAGGIDIIRFEKDDSVSYNASLDIPGQGATCWSAYSSVGDRYYTADLAQSRLVPLTINSTDLSTSLLPSYDISSHSGITSKPVDLRVAHFSDAQDFLYSLDSTDQIVRVFSITPGEQESWNLVQEYHLGEAYNRTGGAVGTSIEGLALFLRSASWQP